MPESRTAAKRLGLSVLTILLALSLPAQQQIPPKPADHSNHTVQFVTVEKDVNLEVLDWGGQGRPLVFLAGGGLDAHEFDEFAPKFTATHHVYAPGADSVHPVLRHPTIPPTQAIVTGMMSSR
jgi:hypothetical protein